MKRPIDAVIEDVIIEPSKIQPIIVNFQNGALKDEEAKKMSCGLFYDQKKKKTTLALSNGQIVYKGYKPETDQDLMHTMLVVHNRKTGKVKLVQVERWQVTPVLDKPVVQDNTAEDEQISVLNKQFGSKKVKRRTEQHERLKMNVEHIKEQLEQTVANVEIDRVELSTQLPDNEYITNTTLPECNRDATSPNDVYDIYDIIPKSKLEALNDYATKILNDESSSLERSTQFFNLTLKYLRSDADNVKKMALLLYIQGVAAWLNMPYKGAKKRSIEICPASEEVNLYIIDTYSIKSNHGRMRPNSIKDKGVIHCMILSLIIYNFTLDLEIFASIFSHRMGLKKLTDLARIIGALPKKENKKVIQLKVPLPTPAPVTRKGKKK
ncbi:DNA-directed RNA polymerase I subunit RPA49 [Anthophora quadrimaculata]